MDTKETPVAKYLRKPEPPQYYLGRGEGVSKHCGARKKQGPGLCARPAGWGTDHPGEGRCKLHGGATPVKHGRYSALRREALRDLIEKHEADPDPLNVLPELAAARALFQDFIERYDEWREAVLAWHASYSEGMRPLHPNSVQALVDVIDELEAHVGPEPESRLEMEAQPHGGALERTRYEREADEEETRIRRSLRQARRVVESLQAAPDLKPREVLDLSDAIRHVDVISKVIDRVEKARSANAISRPNLFRLMAEMGRIVEHHNAEPDSELRLQRIKDGWLGIRLP